MVPCKSSDGEKISLTAVDALLGVLLSCLSKKVGKEGHPVVSPFGYPSRGKLMAGSATRRHPVVRRLSWPSLAN